MYSELRTKFGNELLSKGLCSKEELSKILYALDDIACYYDIEKKEMSLITQSQALYDAINFYLNSKKLAGSTENTLKNKSIIYTRFYKFVKKMPKDINSADLLMFFSAIRQYYYQRNDKEIKGSTMQYYYSALNSMFEFWKQHKIIDENPLDSVDKFAKEKAIVVGLTKKEQTAIRLACGDDLRKRALVEFALATGCRVSEIANLKISDIKDSASENSPSKILIREAKGHKSRVVLIDAEAMTYVQRYLNSRVDKCEYVFVNNYSKTFDESSNVMAHKLSTGAIKYLFTSLSEKTSDILKRPVHIHPHKLRHTFASTMLRRGASIESIKELMGHESVTTTEIYVDSCMEKTIGEYEKCYA